MPFENRGVEVGTTLHHPHGQIYAFPFLPPVRALELEADRRLGGCASCALLGRELDGGERVVHAGAGVVAYVPYAARWPYEVHVVLREHRPSPSSGSSTTAANSISSTAPAPRQRRRGSKSTTAGVCSATAGRRRWARCSSSMTTPSSASASPRRQPRSDRARSASGTSSKLDEVTKFGRTRAKSDAECLKAQQSPSGRVVATSSSCPSRLAPARP